MKYTLTDTIGTSGSIIIDCDTPVREVADWFGLTLDPVGGTIARLVKSLGCRKASWDSDAARLLGVTVEPTGVPA